MNTPSEEKLCAQLDACLGATLQQMWEAFGSVLHNRIDEGAELIFLMVLSVLFGAVNPAQVHQLLGLKGQSLYQQIHAWTPNQWKRLLQEVCYGVAVAELKALEAKSPSSVSRACAVVALDDTLLKRLGVEIGLVWKWWGGMEHRVGRGQNIIALVLVIGDRVIPLDVRIASKQGRVKLTKSLLARQMLQKLAEQCQKHQLDIHRLKLVADSWYTSEKLLGLCRTLELECITAGKSTYKFTVDGQFIKGGKIKQWPLKSTWGEKGAACRKPAEHEDFGKVLLVVFEDSRGKRHYLIATGLNRRAHEILRAYRQRSQIEAFWKRLKSILQIAQIRLQEPTAIRGALVCRVLSYLVADRLMRRLHRYPAFRKVTIHHVLQLCQRFSSILDWIQEHFHHVTIEKPNIVNYLGAI